MSVAAMTLDDDQNSYNNKMQKQMSGAGGFSGGLSGPASPTPSDPPQYHHHHHTQHAPQQHQQRQQEITAEQRMLEEEIESLKIEQTRLAQQCADSQRREKILTRRLANKEQEFQDYVSQIAEYKAGQAPSSMALRSALLDPAVNLLFEKLKKELKATKAKLEETQNELSAWKFTPDSNTGKRLMAKCRLLYQENEELGKMTSSGRLAKLETELAMQKSFSDEVKKTQSELDDFLQELDEDVEGMQSTILFLQQELKTTRERIQVLEKENYQLKNGINDSDAAIVISKDIHNEGMETENNVTQLHGSLNGNTTTLSANNTQHHEQQQQQMISANVHELKFQDATTKLMPIEEEPCVRISAYTCGPRTNDGGGGGGMDFYNGSTDEQLLNSAPTMNAMNDALPLSRSLRVTASRKRVYESTECNEIINETPITPAPAPPVQVIPIVQAPRTLPPKKSKLRMTPPTTQQESLELNDSEAINLTNTGICTISSMTTTTPTAIPTSVLIPQDSTAAGGMATIIDNAVAGMAANEETPINAIGTIDDCIGSGGGVAQRILTRRRSTRAQQNGA